MSESKLKLVKRVPYTIRIPYMPTDNSLLISYLSDPVKFLMIKTLQYSLDLEQYVEGLKPTYRELPDNRTKRRRYSVIARFYNFLMRNARFLKELFQLWELRKVEFLSLFNLIRVEFLRKYQNELFNKLGYEETFALLEKLNQVALEVVSKKIPPSLDDIITETIPSKTLREKLKDFLKEEKDEDTNSQ